MHVGGNDTLSQILVGVNMDGSNKPVYLDGDFLIDQRAIIEGNSGSGKSRGVRTVCENANGKYHQIIISPKREFVTLREKFDYIHVGTPSEISKPDIELNTRYAEQLALTVMKTNIDTIIEFSESPRERVKFVKNFVEGLMQVPQQYWHPVLIIIDEIDIWAPERGHGEAESLNAIIDLAARGRDKGYCLIGATQKLAKFNKDVASELNIKFVGHVTLDIDQTRAADDLGIARRDKKMLSTLGRPNYHFYCYGPGLSDEVIKIKFADPQTSHVAGWKLNKNQKVIPTPDKIKNIISQFSDLPQEAEKELKTKKDLQAKITELNKEISQLKRNQTKQDPNLIDKAKASELVQSGYDKGFKEGVTKTKQNYESQIKTLQHNLRAFKPIMKRVSSIGDELSKMETCVKGIDEVLTIETKLPELPKDTKLPIRTDIPKAQKSVLPTFTPEPTIDGIELTAAQTKILTAVVQRPGNKGTNIQIALVSGYSPKSGHFKNERGGLRSKGLIDYANDEIIATEAGISALGNYTPLPNDNESVQSFWLNKVSAAQNKMLRVLIDEGCGVVISKEELGEKSGYSATSGHFKNELGNLHSLLLVDYHSDGVSASKELFPDD